MLVIMQVDRENLTKQRDELLLVKERQEKVVKESQDQIHSVQEVNEELKVIFIAFTQ